MTGAVRARTEAQNQRYKLTRSYNELLEAFSSKDLQTVGNYELGCLIGKGSFGKVYLATHKLTNGSKVVLKSANKEDSNLAREIHHHRQFLHPHIARLYEVIVTEKLVWLVLEYCPGDELYNYLHENGPLSVEKVQKIFAQLVGAVTYVHNKSCVHRDLKLENILLDKHGNVKLCDFGFTREYEGKSSYLHTYCGTVCYAAPEMLKGEKYAGEKVDVWSLGVILYALLAGELPFDEDDETATKAKILTTEPHYPDHFSPDAKALISALLSKRPLLRPSLADILAHPFLSEHAPQQRAILNLQPPAPFTTKLEKDTLQRMHSAGVDIDKVIENVLAQRCDSLAGWWALLIEKEEKKEIRREKKRRQREAETRSLRRLSGRQDRPNSILGEIDEEGGRSFRIGEPPRSRGRREVRNSVGAPPELPQLPEISVIGSPTSTEAPRAAEDAGRRSASSSRQRPPPPPPKEPRKLSRNSALYLANPELLSPSPLRNPRRSRWHQYPIMNQLNQVRHWLAKRAKSPVSRNAPAGSKNSDSKGASTAARATTQTAPPPRATGPAAAPPVSKPPPVAPATPVRRTSGSRRRTSLSPTPLTPHSSFRRPSAGLHGRKSTSSSVSSVRSVHHRHSHSKASSNSSNSLNSAVIINKRTKSPRNSTKALPATPTAITFPSNIRIVRAGGPPHHNHPYNEAAAFGGLHSPGLSMPKRKRRPMKGPLLSVGTGGGAMGSLSASASSRRESGGSRSTSAAGRRSGEIIEEEDEDDIEEVDAFSPIVAPDEVEVTIDEPAGGRSSREDHESRKTDFMPPPPPSQSEAAPS